jgi:hypothetical protein
MFRQKFSEHVMTGKPDTKIALVCGEIFDIKVSKS